MIRSATSRGSAHVRLVAGASLGRCVRVGAVLIGIGGLIGLEVDGFDFLGDLYDHPAFQDFRADLGDPVPEEEKLRRHQLLMEAQQEISLNKNRALIGRTFPALVAGPLAEMELLLEARLQRQAPEIDGRLLINDGTALPGSLVEVEITEAHAYDTVGRLIRVLSPGEATAVRLPVMG